MFDTFIKYGATEDIKYLAKPHIGTDVLKTVVANMRKHLIKCGCDVRFSTKLTDIEIDDGAVTGCALQDENGEYTLKTNHLVLCPGNSARETFRILKKRGVTISCKNFAVGVRIEHLQKNIDMAQYGESSRYGTLPHSDYKLAVHLENGRGVYTFCMCPGGYVVNASSEEGMLCTNGMSYSKRDGENSNSAVLVSVYPEDFESSSPLAGVNLQRNIEQKAFEAGGRDYCAPVETVGSFTKGSVNKVGSVKPTIEPGYNLTRIEKIFPDFINNGLRAGLNAFAGRLSAFNAEDAILTAAETRSSSPVRIVRNEKLEAVSVKGLYPCGEGAGYAGGIVSAAVDGIKCAEMILTR